MVRNMFLYAEPFFSQLGLPSLPSVLEGREGWRDVLYALSFPECKHFPVVRRVLVLEPSDRLVCFHECRKWERETSLVGRLSI